MFWVYMLRCRDGSYYVGHSDDLARRMSEHEAGAVPCYTRYRRPLMLEFTQAFDSREEALVAERRIKGWSRAKKQAMARGDWAAVGRFARGKNRHTRGPFDSGP